MKVKGVVTTNVEVEVPVMELYDAICNVLWDKRYIILGNDIHRVTGISPYNGLEYTEPVRKATSQELDIYETLNKLYKLCHQVNIK